MTKQDRTVIRQAPEPAEARVKAGVEVKDLEPVQAGTGIIVKFEYGGWGTICHIFYFKIKSD